MDLLMKLFRLPLITNAMQSSMLLDERFTLPALFRVTFFDMRERLMDVLEHPLPHQAFISTVTLAGLGDRDVLARGSHLETLLNAPIDAVRAPDDAPVVLANGAAVTGTWPRFCLRCLSRRAHSSRRETRRTARRRRRACPMRRSLRRQAVHPSACAQGWTPAT